MRVTPNGNSEYHRGNEVIRYGRDISDNVLAACWYHNGLRHTDEPTWAMDPAVEWKVSVSADVILVVDENNGLYSIDRGEIANRTVEIGGREQHLARASDPYVEYLGHPDDHLRGNLWITADNDHEGYHKVKNES